MPYSDIKSRVTIIGDQAFGDAVIAALTRIYEGSPLAAKAIDKWLKNHPLSNL